MSDGTIYVATDRKPLNAEYIRNVAFSQPRRRKDGLDEHEVRSFLEYLAAALEFRDRQLAALIHENIQIKSALRQWQAARFDEDMAALYSQRGGRHAQT
jgi:DivIVA domain-containing protein